MDMGCVGEGIACTEKEVSICAKDSGGPYHYGLTTELIRIAKENKIPHAVDVYPFYGSDVEASLRSGCGHPPLVSSDRGFTPPTDMREAMWKE